MFTEGKFFFQIEFYHMGKCCVCKRALTNPDSIEKGIGPYCEENL